MRRLDEVVSEKCSRHYIREKLKEQEKWVEDKINDISKDLKTG